MKTKYIISIAGALLASALLFSCKNPATEIVEFDPTYGLDPAKTGVDIPKKLDYNPNNIVTISTNPSVTVQLFRNADTGEIKGEGKFEVGLRMRRALDKDQIVNFVLDRSLLSEYPESQLGFIDLPEGVVEEFSIVIPAGMTQVSKTVTLKDITALKDMPGYLTAFKMVLVDAPEGLVASTVGYKVFLKIKVDDAVNLELLDTDPEGKSLPYSSIGAASNFRNDRAGAVTDGYYDQWFPGWVPDSWWVQNKSDSWLTLNFETASVTGFKIYTLDAGNKSKTIKSVRVEVSTDNGTTYTDFGVIAIPDVRRSFSLKFSKPMTINKVRFSSFDGYSTDPNDPWIDIHEIRVFSQK